MSDIHIDDFYKDAARILVQLYRSFPRKNLLLIEDISGPDTPDEYGLHSTRHQAGFGAALWLADSGYLNYEASIRQEGMDQVILTHKAFTLLSSPATTLVVEVAADLPPSVLEIQQTNIHQLREAVRDGSSRQIRLTMHNLMLQMLQH